MPKQERGLMWGFQLWVNLPSQRKQGRALVLAGRPLGEPVSRWGPFVMNTDDEIRQAIEDYRSGRLVQPI